MAIKNQANDPYDNLSPQDRDILRLLSRGMGLTEITARMGISADKLTARYDEICVKFGFKVPEELRAWALRRVALVGVTIPPMRDGQLLLPLDFDNGRASFNLAPFTDITHGPGG